MQQLIYKSRATDSLRSDDIFKIVETSARNNPAREVTGFLAFAHDIFVQLVEGPAASLDGLLADLERDRRHRDLEVLDRRDIDSRSFPTWRMERLAVVGGDASQLLDNLRKAEASEAVLERVEQLYSRPKAA